MSFRLFTKDRAFAEASPRRFLDKKPQPFQQATRMTVFTDTLYETNGVALILACRRRLPEKPVEPSL